MVSYNQFVNKLDPSDLSTSLQAAQKFDEVFKKQDQQLCDTAFTIFSAYYDKMEDALGNKFIDTYNLDSLLFRDTIKAPLPLKAAEYVERLKVNGFMVTESEGDAYINEDRDFIEKWFYDSVSPLMKTYLIQLNKENKKPFDEDAGIIVSPAEFADRTVWWENFSTNNPGFIYHEDANATFKSYLGLIFQGEDNTRVVDLDATKLNSFFIDLYTYLQGKYPQSKTTRLVKPYFEALSKRDTAKANHIVS